MFDCTISMRAMLNLVWPPHPTSPLPQFLGQDLVHLYPCVMFYQCLKIDFMKGLPLPKSFKPDLISMSSLQGCHVMSKINYLKSHLNLDGLLILLSSSIQRISPISLQMRHGYGTRGHYLGYSPQNRCRDLLPASILGSFPRWTLDLPYNNTPLGSYVVDATERYWGSMWFT